jgi:hypothetical protein
MREDEIDSAVGSIDIHVPDEPTDRRAIGHCDRHEPDGTRFGSGVGFVWSGADEVPERGEDVFGFIAKYPVTAVGEALVVNKGAVSSFGFDDRYRPTGSFAVDTHGSRRDRGREVRIVRDATYSWCRVRTTRRGDERTNN